MTPAPEILDVRDGVAALRWAAERIDSWMNGRAWSEEERWSWPILEYHRDTLRDLARRLEGGRLTADGCLRYESAEVDLPMVRKIAGACGLSGTCSGWGAEALRRADQLDVLEALLYALRSGSDTKSEV